MVSFTTLTTFAITALASLAVAAPSKRDTCSPSESISATLIGAAGAEYSVEIPCSGTWTPIDNPLSISHVQTSSGPCTFVGVDGGSLSLGTGSYADFGPPQTVIGAICGYKPW